MEPDNDRGASHVDNYSKTTLDDITDSNDNEADKQAPVADDGKSRLDLLNKSSNIINCTIKSGKSRSIRRKRTQYTTSQLKQLELSFEKTQYPDVYTREELAEKTGITEPRIQVGRCFSNF